MRKDREAVAGLLLRLRELGLGDHRILTAFERIPRQNFVPVIYLDEAYNRGQFPIECGQTMASVDYVARTVHALELPKSAKILELGTGTGYQTAILSCLGTRIYSVERFRTLVEKAKIRLANLEIKNAEIVFADGSDGDSEFGLYDRIVSNCSFDALPKGFLDQLSAGGIMIAPVGPPDGVQTVKKLTKVGARFEVDDLFEVRVQPFIKGVSQAI